MHDISDSELSVTGGEWGWDICFGVGLLPIPDWMPCHGYRWVL